MGSYRIRKEVRENRTKKGGKRKPYKLGVDLYKQWRSLMQEQTGKSKLCVARSKCRRIYSGNMEAQHQSESNLHGPLTKIEMGKEKVEASAPAEVYHGKSYSLKYGHI